MAPMKYDGGAPRDAKSAPVKKVAAAKPSTAKPMAAPKPPMMGKKSAAGASTYRARAAQNRKMDRGTT